MKTKNPKTITGYHFTTGTLRNWKPLPKIGTWLTQSGRIIPCRNGLHMSVIPSDAFDYKNNATLVHKVVLGGTIKSHGYGNKIDKYAGSKRKILATYPVTRKLRGLYHSNRNKFNKEIEKLFSTSVISEVQVNQVQSLQKELVSLQTQLNKVVDKMNALCKEL